MKLRFGTRLVALVLLLAAVSCGGGGADSETGDQAGLPPAGALEPGQPLPDVPLTDLEGNPVRISELIAGRDAVVIVVSLGCEACEDLIASWRNKLDEFPPEVLVFAVADDEPVYAKKYAQEHDFPLPLLCDEKGLLTRRYKLNVTPTVVGVPADGRIAYVGKAVTPVFTPAEAVDLIERTKAARAGEEEGS